MSRLSNVARPDLRLGAFTLLSAALLSVFAAPAFAARECKFFAVTIRDRTFTPGPTGDFRITLPAQFVQGQVAQVRGTYISFNVNLNTFRVNNYLLTGVDAPNQIAPGRTPVFTSKAPATTLSGDLDMRLKASGQSLVMERGGTVDLSIQAKDCDQNGLFQMEVEPAATETNTLVPGFTYCFQAAPDQKRFFTNDIVLGYDSPEVATLLSGTDTTSVWSVTAGGRIGMVVGEDAVEALELAGANAIAACPHQTPTN